MIVSSKKRKGWLTTLLFILVLILIGAGTYYYFIKNKEPTHGIFVFINQIRGEEVTHGYLHQSS